MRRLIHGLAALALAIVTAACSDVPPLPPKPPLEKSTIKVGFVPTADSVPLFIAKNKGYFEQEGLTVEPTIVVGSAAAIPRLMAGALDLMQTDYVSTLTAGSRGLPVKIVGAMSEAQSGSFGLVVRKDSKIRSVKDLKDKKIAIDTLGSLSTLSVTVLLKNAGMTADDVVFVERPFPDMESALVKRGVEAAWLAEPLLTNAEQHGRVRRLPDATADRMAGLPVGGWSATADWSEDNPGTLAAFQRAIAKAQQVAASDRKAVEDTLPTYIKIGRTTAAKAALGIYPTALDPQAVQLVADLMREHGYVKEPLDVKTVIAP